MYSRNQNAVDKNGLTPLRWSTKIINVVVLNWLCKTFINVCDKMLRNTTEN